MDLITSDSVKHFASDVLGYIFDVVWALIKDVPSIEAEVRSSLEQPAQRLLLYLLNLVHRKVSGVSQAVHPRATRLRFFPDSNTAMSMK